MAPGMRRALPRRQGLWRLGLLVVILAIMAGYYAPARDYLERSRQISGEQVVTEELRRQHQALEQEKEQLATMPYVEQVARRDLGMVKPGEQPYVVRDLNQEKGTLAPPAAAEEKSFFDRAGDFFSSLLP